MSNKLVVITLIIGLAIVSSLAISFGATATLKSTLEKGHTLNMGGRNYIEHEPIIINNNSDFAEQAQNEGWPGTGTNTDPYMISGYEIDGQGAKYGIYVGNTTVYFVVENCEIFNTTYGILLYNVTNGVLDGNILYNNSWSIVGFLDSNNKMENNTISDDGSGGMDIWASSNDTVLNNIIGNNSGNGMELDFSSNNSIVNNRISNNSLRGMYLYGSSNNKIENNVISNNSGYGIDINSYSSYNLIYNNSFYYNHGSNGEYNANYIQANDNGTNDYWNSTEGVGNYWYDWANNNDTNDQNHDGIVDWPYKIAGEAGAEDYYPLKYPSSPTPPVPELSSTVFIVLILLGAIVIRKKKF